MHELTETSFVQFRPLMSTASSFPIMTRYIIRDCHCFLFSDIYCLVKQNLLSSSPNELFYFSKLIRYFKYFFSSDTV